MEKINILSRYTDITSLIDILINKRLVLLNPQFWDDKNDSYYMSLYKEHNQLKSLLALCFTTSGETYHHWKVFAGSNNGVCILFKFDKLNEVLNGIDGIKSGLVNYPKMKKLEGNESSSIESFPFIKRYAFRDEKEFRIIRESVTSIEENYAIELPITAIARVSLSPWINQNLVEGIKNLINTIPGCEKLDVSKSKLIDSITWKKYAEKLLAQKYEKTPT